VVRLDRVQVGASLVTGLEASVHDLPAFFRADGLLGLNFLRRFRVTFEFDTRTLVLREPPPRRRTP
jgi:predicted aspartyl protease